MTADKQWVVGRAQDCDIVVNDPGVSSRHCRLYRTSEGLFLEDLKSTNGTFVNGVRIQTTVSITPNDHILLGTNTPFPWPKKKTSGLSGKVPVAKPAHSDSHRRPIMLGRDPAGTVVLTDPQISFRHARILHLNGNWILEDLNSTNGTFLNGQRVSGKVPIKAGHVIALGQHRYTFRGDGTFAGGDCRDQGVTLEARGVCVDVQARRLLDGISLTVKPTEFVGLMGPSGAGKTTLMNALNGYTEPSEGGVYLNGMSLYDHYDEFRNFLGYVPQDDIIHSNLTVGQALYFTARLRLPLDYSEDDIRQRIDKVLTQLNLQGTENVLIGSAEKKGISGGQRKRVNLAMELLTDPLVLFLDEPTSGLSSEDALIVMKVLRKLADSGKTIILTLHQPSLEAYRLMNNLILVGRNKEPTAPGILAYYGPAYPEALTFFNPPQEPSSPPLAELNPDHLFRGMANRPATEWNSLYKATPMYHEFVIHRISQPAQANSLPGSGHNRQFFPVNQWWVLVQRSLAIKAKDLMNTIVLFAQAPIIAILIALVFGARCHEELTADNWEQMTGSVGTVIFLLGLAGLWFGSSNSVREIVGEWAIYRRERMVNLQITAYVASKLAVMAGLCILQCAMLMGIVYWGCALQANFWLLFSALLCVSLVGVLLGLTLSSVARNTEIAVALLPLVLLPMVIMAGAVMPLKDMNPKVRMLCNAVPSRWAFEAMMLAESDGRPDYPIPEGIPEPDEIPDFAEGYFPEENHRYGIKACFLGLGLCALVLLSATVLTLYARDIH